LRLRLRLGRLWLAIWRAGYAAEDAAAIGCVDGFVAFVGRHRLQSLQAKLASHPSRLTTNAPKQSWLTHERDEAVHAANGGSVLRRIARNAKWLAIGALAEP